MTPSCLLLLALAASAGAAPAPAPERVLSLEDAERLALLNDARVLSAEQDKIIAVERVREARYLFLPEVGVQASATKFEARYPFALSSEFRNILLFPDAPGPFGATTSDIFSGRGYLHMPLYEGGRRLSTLRLAQAAQKQATTSLDSVRMDTRLAARDVFYRLVLAQEKAAASARHLDAVADLLAPAALGAWERLEAEALLGSARARASDDQHQLDLARLAFLRGLNVELDTPFRVVGSLETRAEDVDIDKAVLWAMELRPELQSETYKAQMDAISVNLAYARRIPTVFLGGDYELTGPSFPLKKNNWDISIGIKIPFSYDYVTKLRQKRAEQRQGQIKRAELQDRVRLEVRQAYENLQYWQKEWPLREAQYRKVLSLYDGASRQPGPPLSKARALAGLLDLRVAYLASAAEHLLSKARLERAVGRPLSQ